MFLPTKAHTKEVIPKQYRLRKGNRVPQGAVNLAYAHVRELAPQENIRITDLSNTILENQQNGEATDQIMIPSNAMLLENLEYDSNIPASDVLVTNSFQDGVPLYYRYRLEHRIYDKKGPNKYGVYSKTGMNLIDKSGKEVNRPYRFELTPDPNNIDMYFVDLLTSFNDIESEEYKVVYNAVQIEMNGITIPKAGHRERIVLSRAFVETNDITKIVENYMADSKERIYYKGNAERPYNSRLFVGSAEFLDERPYEYFRYQIGVELDYENTTEICTTPWYTDHVIHTDYLSDSELSEYYNGYKKITDKKVEELMKGYIISNNTYGALNSMRYFINIDNPNVRDSTRADGSSEIFVKSITRYPTYKQRELPENIHIIDRPYDLSSMVKMKLRTIHSLPTEMAYISFVMDNSQSMGVSDPMKLNRKKIIESAMYAALDYYNINRMNCLYFANTAKEIRYAFEPGGYNIVDSYSENAPNDLDITRPDMGLAKSIELLNAIPNTELVNDEVKTIEKFSIIVTDGEYDSGGWANLTVQLKEAKKRGIKVGVFTFNNYDMIKAVCDAEGAVCYDCQIQNITMNARNLFFDLKESDAIELGIDIPFTTSPTENDKMIALVETKWLSSDPTFAATTNNIISNPHDELSRWAIELFFEHPSTLTYNQKRMLSLYVQRNDSKTILGTYRTKDIIRLKDVWDDPRRSDDTPISFNVYVHSKSYKYYITSYYSVRFNDRQSIKLLSPRELSSKESWYARIKNGRFDREQRNKTSHPIEIFSIPEYYRQDFLYKEPPVMRVKGERALFINENTIKLSCTPFVFDRSDKNTEMIVRVNGSKMGVVDWNSFNGLVTLNGVIDQSDNIVVDYTYEEHSYVYKGYHDNNGVFWHLDLNPTKGHYCTYLDPMDNTIKDVPSFYLIDKVIYFYIRASVRSEKDLAENLQPISDVNKYTVMHTFEKIESNEYLLIGEIRIRPNSNQQNIRLFDSRTRGGGLDSYITLNDIQRTEPESIYYWDIGYWDGQPFPENGIAVIRISRYILKEYGGRFTKVEVEEKVQKHLALGVLPIIEYMNDPEILIPKVDGIVVEVHEIEEVGQVQILKPTFDLEVRSR